MKAETKAAATQGLTEVVHFTLMDTIGYYSGLEGLMIDGLCLTHLAAFERMWGQRIGCLIRITCPQEVMLQRLAISRSIRGGEEAYFAGRRSGAERVCGYQARAEKERDQVISHVSPIMLCNIT